jgi:hypothetical protein
MATRHRTGGAALLLACVVILVAFGAIAARSLTLQGTVAKRERTTSRALAQAREALLAHGADRPIDAWVGPGYLPCPDTDNDGWAESTCGSLNGDSGQAQRLGRLPWKTLGLPDLRDGDGERLWYAVSTKYKGLLNCAASASCLDMTPATAWGTITVRDSSGALLHDGTVAGAAGGALAVVIAPGAPLARRVDGGDAAAVQSRACAPGDCDALERCLTLPPQRAAPCDPRNYLDRAPGPAFADEDNADFVDRSDAAGRPRNRNGFIQGPVRLADGRIAVNDRLLPIAYGDLMPRLMHRVAREVASCLRFYGSRPENGGRYPRPRAVCARGPLFGNVPDTPFAEAHAASGGQMLERWWRVAPRDPEDPRELPTRDDACRIAVPPEDAGPRRTLPAGATAAEAVTAGTADRSWWDAWKPFAYYTLAPAFEPASPPDAAGCGLECVQLLDPSGAAVGGPRRYAVIVAAACPDAAVCPGDESCRRVALSPLQGGARHGVAAFP